MQAYTVICSIIRIGIVVAIIAIPTGCRDGSDANLSGSDISKSDASVAERSAAFAEQFLIELRAIAWDRSDLEAGHTMGASADYDIRTHDDGSFTLAVEMYHEDGRHEGTGRTKQTTWHKYRGTTMVVFVPTSAAPGFEVSAYAYAGKCDHKPLSTYTDASLRTVTDVTMMPELDELVQGAMRRLADESESF
ncbi:MAG: hypothetical protein AAF432_08625 [Planctomycetota bacterium]